ncbi:MAG: peptidylprolyl isomerase, partial [Bacteroidales bacterium]|nr:peptidylprolyl isomerase [Bacteroidales bacterium]
MKYFYIFILIGFLGNPNVFGQLLTVGNQRVSKEEFIQLYTKNTPNATFDERSLRDYLSRLTAYKLKVQEALDERVDRVPHVQRELRNYAEQLAQPYLTDRELLEKMLREAYEHSSQDAHARQIMVRCSPFANPQDSLVAYRTAMRIRERLVRGEDFDKVAAEETEKSDIVTVGSREEKRVNSSDLRYFSSFAMPYSIEKFAFSSKIGEFSMPLRTDIGFHIVQTLDRQPTLGRINASQIFLNIPEGVDEREIRRRADSLYYLITSGTHAFEQIARNFSDDKTSGMRGGRLAEFNITRVGPILAANLYKMPIEVVSRPFRAEQGYYIMIIHDVSGVGEYETMRPELLYRLQRDPRAELIKKSFVNSLLKIYPLTEIKGTLAKFASTIDSTEVDGFWSYDPDDHADEILFKLGDRTITFEDFGNIVERNQMDYHSSEELFMTFIERTYRRHIGDIAILCETDNVGNKYEEFNRDFNDYRDGILAYEITDRRVWTKSSEDTIGLYEYYDSQKHCFLWPARIQALIFRYDVRHIKTENVQKFLTSSYRKRLSADQIIDQANRNFDPRHISVTINVYEPGQNKFADRVDWTQLG